MTEGPPPIKVMSALGQIQYTESLNLSGIGKSDMLDKEMHTYPKRWFLTNQEHIGVEACHAQDGQEEYGFAAIFLSSKPPWDGGQNARKQPKHI